MAHCLHLLDGEHVGVIQGLAFLHAEGHALSQGLRALVVHVGAWVGFFDEAVLRPHLLVLEARCPHGHLRLKRLLQDSLVVLLVSRQVG